MDDALAVRAVERLGDLDPVAEDLLARERAARETRRQGLPFEVFHDEILGPVLVADVVEDADVRMRQARDRPRLALEAFAEAGARGEMRREDFDGDGAVEPRVDGAVHLAHPAGPDRRLDLVRSDAGPGAQRHGGTADYTALHLPRFT